MTEKKTKCSTNKTTCKKTSTKKVENSIDLSVENIGFKAGDVYNALAAAKKALSIEEIAKKAKITIEESYLGIGWLYKEGKVKGEETKVTLA